MTIWTMLLLAFIVSASISTIVTLIVSHFARAEMQSKFTESEYKIMRINFLNQEIHKTEKRMQNSDSVHFRTPQDYDKALAMWVENLTNWRVEREKLVNSF